ncbi:MAG: LCP family protein [Mycobacterium sp.]
MTPPAGAAWDTEVLPRVGAPRHGRADTRPRGRRNPGARRALAGAKVLGALAATIVLAATGLGWSSYRNIAGGITTSQALVGGAGGTASTGGDENILIMGLDSRLDQHGQPLPQDIYDALHAGDESVGGYNSNVLIVLHIPGDGGQITAISIPRDDYVKLAGCPTSDCKGKVKQAYGMAYQNVLNTADKVQSGASSDNDPMVTEQEGREAGRKAEIKTVRELLGIPIDHFVEVTLAAFFQIAQVVQPITVCLNADTADSFSGAQFHQGVQEIDAAQAMAFVRQRRDVNDELFTDMDRTRRQQAFIASLLSALRHGGALSSPTALRHLLDVARQNVAVDSGFDLAAFVQHASAFTDRQVSLYTLPIAEFGQDRAGEDVNVIDVPTIRAIVHNLVTASASGSPSTSPTVAPAVPAVLDVVNATAHAGLASALVDAFSSHGFTPGQATTAPTLSDNSTILYGHGARDAAQVLADHFGLVASASNQIEPNRVQLTIGADFPAGEYSTDERSDTATALGASPGATAPVTTVSATATGAAAPVPTDLSKMNATDTPCVK